MIVLPNTPTPKRLGNDKWPSELVENRAAVSDLVPETFNDSIRYLVNLEQYIETLFSFAASKTTPSLTDVIPLASEFQIVSFLEPPWINIKIPGFTKQKLKFVKSPKSEWYLYNEIEMSIITTCFVYIRLGSDLANELIEIDGYNSNITEIDAKWKQVTGFYKKAIAYIQFGAQINKLSIGNHIDDKTFILLENIANISLQLSILSKSAWVNRNKFMETELFTTTNNATLARVAIYVLDKLDVTKLLITNLHNSTSFGLNCDNWLQYLQLIKKYSNAYAGLFLAIDSYQQNQIGKAIGLVNFSLLNLQSKNSNTKSKFREKLSTRKNEKYIQNLQSTTSLDLKNSLFNEKSGIVLKDISYLFDQSIEFRLKLTKENDNLHFDTIIDFQDIGKDTKWPLGCKIPINIDKFMPKVFGANANTPGRTYY